MNSDEYVEYEEVKDTNSKENSKMDSIREMMSNKDFQKMFMRLHTPLTATKLPGRNDVCPYCNSGKKFKKCECYKTHKVEYTNPYF